MKAFIIVLLFLNYFSFSFAYDGISKLNGRSPDLPAEDLKVIDTLARKAKVLALGESAHGSAGYLEMQHRIVRYLVLHHGYRQILMEALSDDRSLNNYISAGEGSLKEALYLNNWHENNKQRFEFYNWLREYNRKHPLDQVKLIAVDAQKPWQDAPSIRTYLASIDVGISEEYSSPLEGNCLGASFKNQIEWAFSEEGQNYSRTRTIPQDKHSNCVQAVEDLQKLFFKERMNWQRRSGLQAYEEASYALKSLKAWQLKSYYLYSDEKKALKIREEAFTQNVLWNTITHSKKSIFIAHNFHISKYPLYPQGDSWDQLQTVGLQLSTRLQDSFKSIALTGYEVSAVFSRSFPLPVTKASLDLVLKGFQEDHLFLDPKKAEWIKSRDYWLMHAGPKPRPFSLPSSFDGIIFHRSSEKAVFLD